jgi:hypothetical protein
MVGDMSAVQAARTGLNNLIAHADSAVRVLEYAEIPEMEAARVAVRELDDAERMLLEITNELAAARSA